MQQEKEKPQIRIKQKCEATEQFKFYKLHISEPFDLLVSASESRWLEDVDCIHRLHNDLLVWQKHIEVGINDDIVSFRFMLDGVNGGLKRCLLASNLNVKISNYGVLLVD